MHGCQCSVHQRHSLVQAANDAENALVNAIEGWRLGWFGLFSDTERGREMRKVEKRIPGGHDF